ncbi:TIGR02466 family protein [Shimia litoralis]|nr:TIGR02466 family protein [Shimia litoralis]
MLKQTKFEKLFSTPIMRFQLEDHVVLNAELLFEGEQMRSADAGVSKSNRGGWHSKGNLFENEYPCFQKVQTAAKEAVYQVTRKVSSKVDPEALRLKMFAWMNANPTSGYNAPHTHPGAHWSGVYYVSQPNVENGSSGMIEFLDPRSDLPHWRILEASAFRAKRTIRPMAGELIIFPSYLVHWVHPNENSDDRVTIAFNATFRRPKA